MVWLQYAGPGVSGLDAGTGGAVVLGGPGTAPVRGPGRVNNVLTAVREMVVHAVADGAAPGSLLPVLFDVADDRELPAAACGDEARTGWRMRARHRLAEPDRAKGRASDEQIAALVSGCLSARDRLIVVLLARAGLRRGEAYGLRRSDCHLLVDSAALGCGVKPAHLRVVRRDNGNGAWAKSPHERVVPLDHVSLPTLRPYSVKIGEAGPEATIHSLPADSERVVIGPVARVAARRLSGSGVRSPGRRPAVCSSFPAVAPSRLARNGRHSGSQQLCAGSPQTHSLPGRCVPALTRDGCCQVMAGRRCSIDACGADGSRDGGGCAGRPGARGGGGRRAPGPDR